MFRTAAPLPPNPQLEGYFVARGAYTCINYAWARVVLNRTQSGMFTVTVLEQGRYTRDAEGFAETRREVEDHVRHGQRQAVRLDSLEPAAGTASR